MGNIFLSLAFVASLASDHSVCSFAIDAFIKKRHRLIAVGGILFFLLIQFCNRTRGAWLALAVTMVFILVLYMKSWYKVLAAMLVMIVCVGAVFITVPQLNERLVSITDLQANSERIRIWTSAWHMYNDRPILGMGLAEFKEKYQKEYILPEAKERGLTHAHSNVMQTMAEGGTIGIVAWSIFWIYVIWFGIRVWLRQHRLSGLAISAMTLGLLVQGMTEYNLGNSIVVKDFWFVFAIFLQIIYLPNISAQSINKEACSENLLTHA